MNIFPDRSAILHCHTASVSCPGAVSGSGFRPVVSAILVVLGAAALLCLPPAAAAGTGNTDAPALVKYTVQKGDTLIGIGRRMLKRDDGWHTVAEINRLPNIHRIYTGQRLLVPADNLLAKPQEVRIVQSSGTVSVLDASSDTSDATVTDSRAVGEQGGSVQEGQVVQTDSNGSAVLQMQDGSRFKVLPDSTVRLLASRNYLKNKNTDAASGSADWFSGIIRVINGALEANVAPSSDKATPTQVQTPTAVVGVRGTQFRVRYQKAQSRNSAVEVTKGLVAASNTQQASQSDVRGGYGAMIDPAQKAVVVRQLLPAIAQENLPGSIVRQYGSRQAVWSFTGLPQAAGYQLQVARDAEGQQVVKTIRSAAASIDVSSLKDGTWYFNLRAVDSAGLAGMDSYRTVRISTAQPTPVPTPVPAPVPVWTDSVANSSYLEWKGNYNAASLTFTLTGQWYPQAARVEVADNPQMLSARSYTSQGHQVVFYHLLAGRTYYVRFSDSHDNISRVYSVHIPLGWGQRTGYLQNILRSANEYSDDKQ